MESMQIRMSQLAHRVTFSKLSNTQIGFHRANKELKSKSIVPSAKPLVNILSSKLNLTTSMVVTNKKLPSHSLPQLPKLDPEVLQPDESSQESFIHHKTPEMSFNTNSQPVTHFNYEVMRLKKQCQTLEEAIIRYEKDYNQLKAKLEEAELEKKFLAKKLRSIQKKLDAISLPIPFEIKFDNIYSSNSKNEHARKSESEYCPTSSSGKYLLSLTKAFPVGSLEFYTKIENFLEFKEHKLRKSIEHYTNTIRNLKVQLKKKNSDYISGININNLGAFFSECVEEVKQDIITNRSTPKFFKNDKFKILEKFLLNENVLKIIYENLISFSKASDKSRLLGLHDEIFPSLKEFPEEHEDLSI